MDHRNGFVGGGRGERQVPLDLLGERQPIWPSKEMKLARSPKGEMALGASSRRSLVWPKSEVKQGRFVLCGAGVVDLSIKSYARSPVHQATLLLTSEFGFMHFITAAFSLTLSFPKASL